MQIEGLPDLNEVQVKQRMLAKHNAKVDTKSPIQNIASCMPS